MFFLSLDFISLHLVSLSLDSRKFSAYLFGLQLNDKWLELVGSEKLLQLDSW
jgi:hypothetical protein